MRRIAICLLLTSSALCCFAREPQSFFRDEELILSGSYYYPEQWPEEQWDRDLKRMAELGFAFTHFGEFAWAAMEPEEGRYDFSWLDRAVELAARHGLKVILCTPTATPPAWLTEKHPDVLVMNEAGRRLEHGGRQQASWASATYRTYVEKIVTTLAERYGHNPAVWGWQIDNEPSHYAYSYDHSENAQRSFRRWLRNRYCDIDRLNRAWGTAFWSLTYNDFNQIRIPNQQVLAGTANPHAVLDYKRYTADEAAGFIDFQCAVMRPLIAPGQWITTNTMPGHSPVDPARMTGPDFPCYTRYLVNGRYAGHGEQGFRISNPELLGWNNDYYRPMRGVTGVMEIQPGQVNWGKFNPQPCPGAVRLWMYHIFAGGSRFVCHYRFRQPLRGSEQYHSGTLSTDGVSLSRGGREIVQFNREMELLRKSRTPGAQLPARLAALRTAIMVNPDNRWDMEFQPLSDQWSTTAHLNKYYNLVKRTGAPVDIVGEAVDPDGYPVLIAPAYELVDSALVERWEAYARRGGHLVLTCRTAQKDRTGALWEAKPAEPIYRLAGIRELWFDHLPRNKQASVDFDGGSYHWNNWADVLTPEPGTAVWAAYADQFYAGMAAVVHRPLGKGTVTYIGPDTDDGALEYAVLRRIYDALGEPYDLPAGVVVEWRDGFFISLNYTSSEQTVPAGPGARMLVGSPTLPPADVAVWQE